MSTSPAEFHRDDVRTTLQDAGLPPNRIYLLDEWYALPSERDVERIGAYCRGVMRDLGYTYRDESRDCDDFARLVTEKANQANAVTQLGKEMHSGLAFGLLTLTTRQHALCLAVHLDDQGKPYVEAYEPQPTLGDKDMAMKCLRPVPLRTGELSTAGLCIL